MLDLVTTKGPNRLRLGQTRVWKKTWWQYQAIKCQSTRRLSKNQATICMTSTTGFWYPLIIETLLPKTGLKITKTR